MARKTNSQILNEIAHLLPQTFRVQDHWVELVADTWDASSFHRIKGFLDGLHFGGVMSHCDYCEADAILEQLRDE